MTGREKLTGRRRWIIAVAIAGFAVFVGGIFMGQRLFGPGVAPQILLAISISGFIVAFLTMMYANLFGLRCPWCRGNMAPLLMQHRMNLGGRVRFCPYCGRDLDEELSEAVSADADYTSEYDR